MLLGKCSRYIQYALQIAQDSQENLCTYKKSLKIFNMDRVAWHLGIFPYCSKSDQYTFVT